MKFISIKKPFLNPDAFRRYDEAVNTRVFSDDEKAREYLNQLHPNLTFLEIGGYWVSDNFTDTDGKTTFITVSDDKHAPRQYRYTWGKIYDPRD